MTPEQALRESGYFISNELMGKIPSSVGYIKKFRWSWLATQLNTFIIIGEADKTIGRQEIENFSYNCYEYSIKNNKGWPRGLQSGVGAIAILKGPQTEPGAIQFCESLSKKHWSAFEIPVVYNTTERKAYRFQGTPIWGRLYFPYFAKLIDEITGKF